MIRSISSPRAVSISTYASENVRSWRQTSMPSSPGSMTSRMTTSGLPARTASSAAGPSAAVVDREPLALEVAAHEVDDRRLVVDDEDSRLLDRSHPRRVGQIAERRNRSPDLGDHP